jgi:hypothetical protein
MLGGLRCASIVYYLIISVDIVIEVKNSGKRHSTVLPLKEV